MIENILSLIVSWNFGQIPEICNNNGPEMVLILPKRPEFLPSYLQKVIPEFKIFYRKPCEV